METEATDVDVDVLFVSCAADFSKLLVSWTGIEAAAALLSVMMVDEAQLGADLEVLHLTALTEYVITEEKLTCKG
jgi:hypothetical protein